MKRFGLILVLSASTLLAQQKDQAEAEYQAYVAQFATKRAQLTGLKAEETADLAVLLELRKRLSEAHPDVVKLRKRLDELRAEEASLTSPGLDRVGPQDRWWRNPATAQSLGLTADQQKKMDDVFQQSRLKLIDLNAALEKEEVTLEPLVAAESLDEAKTSAQIDRVAQARAELEKANGRMLLGIRKLLTPDQWSKLNTSKLQIK